MIFSQLLYMVTTLMAATVSCQETAAGVGLFTILDDLLPSMEKIYPLGEFGPKATIDPRSITVSGLSSGAFMAMQIHVAHSRIIRGAGMFAGGAYGRTYGSPAVTSNTISGILSLAAYRFQPPKKSVAELVEQARTFEEERHIDPLSNLNGSKAYVYHGDLDTSVPTIEGTRVVQMYKSLGADVRDKAQMNGQHGMPTDNYGGPCEIFDPLHDGLNNCGYEGVFDMFDKFYSDFVLPSSSTAPLAKGSSYYVFDQSPFVPSAHLSSKAYMAKVGYVYIPPGCQEEGATTTCKLHIALHGCTQNLYSNSQFLENKFATRSGYTQAADANNITIVFPQAAPLHLNPLSSNLACWDFFGATGKDFLFKSGPQIQALYNIIAHLAGFESIP